MVSLYHLLKWWWLGDMVYLVGMVYIIRVLPAFILSEAQRSVPSLNLFSRRWYKKWPSWNPSFVVSQKVPTPIFYQKRWVHNGRMGRADAHQNTSILLLWLIFRKWSGWWLSFNPSEKYEFVSWDDMDWLVVLTILKNMSSSMGRIIPYMVSGIPTPLKDMSSSVGMMEFPIYGKS